MCPAKGEIQIDVLLTNDDGASALGLSVMREALLEVDGVRLGVIAPDSNRSAAARTFTMGPLAVEEVEFDDGSTGFSTNGTPVDCIRLAALGLLGFIPDVVIAGINHGVNLGDDIAYSGTVAAALEAMVLGGVPSIAVSQQSRRRELDFLADDSWQSRDFEQAARFVAHVVAALPAAILPAGTLLNVNCPTGRARGVRTCRLGRRLYEGGLHLIEESDGRRSYAIYGTLDHRKEVGTDFEVLRAREIAVTPLHFDLTDDSCFEALQSADLDSLLAASANL